MRHEDVKLSLRVPQLVRFPVSPCVEIFLFVSSDQFRLCGCWVQVDESAVSAFDRVEAILNKEQRGIVQSTVIA